MIPLFPIKIAILPEEILPLHIFEDRYKKMISESISSNQPFGIIYKDKGQISNIGCAVCINKIINKYEDGKYDILVKGQYRFKITKSFKKENLWHAQIKTIDERYDYMDQKIFAQILDKYLQVLLSYNINHNIQNEMTKTKSFDFTKDVVIPTPLKQEFLELEDEPQRMIFIEQFLDSIISNSDQVKTLNFKDKILN